MVGPMNTNRFGASLRPQFLVRLDAYELPRDLWMARWATGVVHAYELPRSFSM